MDSIREQFKKPLVVGAAGLIVGILLGILYGWFVDPIEWVDQPMDWLRADLKEEYLRAAIDSYAMNPDPVLAKKRYQDVGADADEILAKIVQSPGTQNAQVVSAFQSTVLGGAIPLPATTPSEGAPVEPEEGGTNFWGIALPILCVIGLLIAAGLFYVFFLRGRPAMRTFTQPARAVKEPAPSADWGEYAPGEAEPPMVQFMSSYKLGDDLFDESFSVDSPAGEFLGECGVGISETIGVGDPKKVTAFEVWLFDKNDIQTVTKVLMSAHAFLDEPSRQRLAAKGEPVLVEPGAETVLETQSLRLVARVVDTGYGEGALPDHSFFDRMILEMAIWPKS